MEMKGFSELRKRHLDVDDITDYSPGDWGGSSDDARDMQRLGKKQEFKRNFNFLSALGFVSIYMATWEFTLVFDFSRPAQPPQGLTMFYRSRCQSAWPMEDLQASSGAF